MIKDWNYAGGRVRANEPSFTIPTRGLISGLVPHYRLPHIPKFSSWSSSFMSCRYLPARIIPILNHYGHELNSQIFLTIYFCTRFFLRQEILQQHFLRHKTLHIYFGVCCFFAFKNKWTNICYTNNCNAESFDAKNDVAKIKPQKFLWIYSCINNFCVKIFAQKIFVSQYFVYLFLQQFILQHMFLCI